jgi:hypothetical protein
VVTDLSTVRIVATGVGSVADAGLLNVAATSVWGINTFSFSTTPLVALCSQVERA